MIADIVTLLIPVYILIGLLLLLIALNVLARVQGGRYVRPIAMALMKVPFLKRWLQKASKTTAGARSPSSSAAACSTTRRRRRRPCLD